MIHLCAEHSGSVENKPQNITIPPVTLTTPLNETGSDEDYSRKSNRPEDGSSTTNNPVVRRPSTTSTLRPARPTKRPVEGPVKSWDQAGKQIQFVIQI